MKKINKTIKIIINIVLIIFFGIIAFGLYNVDRKGKMLNKGFGKLHETFVKNIKRSNYSFVLHSDKLEEFFLRDSCKKITLFINTQGCQRCYDTLLEQIEASGIDKSKFLIISSFSNARYAKVFRERHNAFTNFVNIRGLTLTGKELEDENLLFILNNDCKASDVFIPNIRFPKLTEEYLKTMGEL